MQTGFSRRRGKCVSIMASSDGHAGVVDTTSAAPALFQNVCSLPSARSARLQPLTRISPASMRTAVSMAASRSPPKTNPASPVWEPLAAAIASSVDPTE